MIYNFDNLSFQILTIDRICHKPGFFCVNARPFSVLSLRVSGVASFEVGGKALVSVPGDILFIPADTPYKVEYSFSESIVVHFADSNYCSAESIRPNNSAWIDRQFHHLLSEWEQKHSINQAKSLIYDIFEKMDNDQKLSAQDRSITDCVCYMDTKFHDPQTNIKTVCEAAFVTPSTLQRGFATYVGMSPKQYLNQLRMNRALELLAENKLSVKDIALACGFIDEKYFSRAFKKKYGYSPSHMRKHMVI